MDPVVLVGACIILASILILFATGLKKRSRNLPPGSYGWPVVGESLEFLRRNQEGKPEKFVTDRMSKYKSEVFKTSLMGEPVVVLSGPAGNKFLYSNENKLVNTWWPISVQKLLGTCLSTSVGDEAKQMRKLMAYFVSPDAMEKLYIKTMDFVTQQHIQHHWQGKEEMKVSPAVKLYTFELACRFFMSVEDPEHIKKLSSLFNVFLRGVISLPVNIPGTKFYRAMRATAVIREELLRIVRHRREALMKNNNNNNNRHDLLSHLLVTPDENGSFMSELHIVNNIILLLFAGHDTSTVTITLLIKKLGDLPHVYEKVLQVHREIAATKEGGEFLHWDDIQKMKYSWNVVCEVMRQYSPVIGAFREALVDINYKGYHIPKGWKIYWNTPITHMNASFFPKPMEFDPSRFEGDGAVPYTFVPFGGGPRMCLGKEFARLQILTFLHNVVKRFRWSLVVPEERLEYDPLPIPVQGLPIRLHPHKL
ncbi:PREDICTED: beta-amyrin 28-oxidase-like [Ipomoea nil]|uniref:beta-amyrin 28-oxidase-like n=1 Tax=Ipomoea nil TaxID=35883 RepID=UPI00090190FF|nr:PREDICTED: beta-amyrin 28-oxidase-like [Ipomoea nil]